MSTPRSLCPVHKRTKEVTETNRQRLLPTESDLSVLYLLDVLLGTTTLCRWGHLQITIRCPGATETQELYERFVARLHMMVSVLCLTIAWRSQATRLSETKETRDITFTSDWLKETSVIVTRANVSRMFYH